MQKRAQESKIFRGEALHLRRKLALEKLRWSSKHQLLACPGLTKTRLWKPGTVRCSADDGGKFGVFAATVLLRWLWPEP